MKWLLIQVRRITRVARWLDRHHANRELQKLRAAYAPDIAKATKEKNWNKRESLDYEISVEEHLILDPIHGDESEDMVAEARKLGIIVPPKTEESADWSQSNVTGDWILTYSGSLTLAKAIREEKRARYDELRKWATLIFALLGFSLGLFSVLRRTRSDPCPVNYYRTDSGACEFALKPSSGLNRQVQPSPAVIPADDSTEKRFVPH